MGYCVSQILDALRTRQRSSTTSSGWTARNRFTCRFSSRAATATPSPLLTVVVIENIFRHMEEGEDPVTASERGGQEVSLAVLAATFTTAIVFFPVIFLAGISRYLFTALAIAVVLALAASYLVAMSVVPLFCARFIKSVHGSVGHHPRKSGFQRFVSTFNYKYDQMLMRYDRAVGKVLRLPGRTVVVIMGGFVLSLALFPFLGVAFFPRTDPAQFVINIKAPTGTRLELTNKYIGQVENDIRQAIPQHDLKMIVANIGVNADLSAIYTSNSAQHTAFVQVSLNEDHSLPTFTYMNRVRRKLSADLPEISTYFQTGGLVDSVVNAGMPAPIDIQVAGNNQHAAYQVAADIANRVRSLRDVNDVLIPQDLDYPGIELDVRREMAARLGLTASDVIRNVTTALNSNGMIAPGYWVDPHSGNNYFLTVQYTNQKIGAMTMEDFKQIPLKAKTSDNTTMLENVADIKMINTPTEVDHHQLFRVIDVYVAPKGEDLGGVAKEVGNIIKQTKLPPDVRIEVRGSVRAMQQSFRSFGFGLLLAIVLVYLILMAQFASFIDPFIILLAIPPGITGVIGVLLVTGTTLNIMSLMGVIMMTGIVVSNSILIVDVTRIYRRQGMPIAEAVALACRVRLRPILMTSLATILGLIPMALALEAGSEQYAPLARSIIGGLTVSVVVTVFLVPAAYLLIHRKEERQPEVEA